MTRVVQTIAALLVLDAPARRALDEAAADWRLEVADAHGFFARTWRHVSSVIAVARVIALSGFRGVMSWETAREIAVALAWTAVISPLFGVPYLAGTSSLPSSVRGIALFAYTIAMAATVFPMVLTAVATRVPRRDSLIGLSIASFVLMLCLNGWITPASNQFYRENMYAALVPAGPATHARQEQPRRGLAELNLVELIRASVAAPEMQYVPPLRQPVGVAGAPTRGGVLKHLNVRLLLIFAPPILLLLAAQWPSKSRLVGLIKILPLGVAYGWTFSLASSWSPSTLVLPWIVLLLAIGAVTWMAAWRAQRAVLAGDPPNLEP